MTKNRVLCGAHGKRETCAKWNYDVNMMSSIIMRTKSDFHLDCHFIFKYNETRLRAKNTSVKYNISKCSKSPNFQYLTSTIFFFPQQQHSVIFTQSSAASVQFCGRIITTEVMLIGPNSVRKSNRIC